MSTKLAKYRIKVNSILQKYLEDRQKIITRIGLQCFKIVNEYICAFNTSGG